MTNNEWYEERAAASAKLLLKAGDVDGACNRAYYAMFDAAPIGLFCIYLKNMHIVFIGLILMGPE